MIRTCDVCEEPEPVINWRGQILCTSCGLVAIESAPDLLRFRARDALARGDEYTENVLSNVAGWLEVHHGDPVAPEPGT